MANRSPLSCLRCATVPCLPVALFENKAGAVSERAAGYANDLTPLSPNCPLIDGDVGSSIWPAVRPAGGAADGAGGS